MNLSALNILVGTACDLHCPYCIQQSSNDIINNKTDIKEFAISLKSYLDSQKIESIRCVQIWGGEPLLYFKNIKDFFYEFSDFNFEKFRICTNGRRIDDNYVEFANSDNRIYTTVSCHGFGFNDKQIETMANIRDVSFTELITHQRTDLEEVQQWFYRIYNLTKKYPTFSINPLYSTPGCGEDFELTADDLIKFRDYMVNNILHDASNGDVFANHIIKRFINSFLSHSNLRPHGDCSFQNISVDTHGNVYGFCHHNFDRANITGTIYNFKKTIPIRNLSEDRFDLFKEKNCKSCIISDVCSFRCPVEKDFDIMCIKNKILWQIYTAFVSYSTIGEKIEI